MGKMVESIGQWHGDRRVNEGAQGWCAWVSLGLEVSRLLPCKLDLCPAPRQCDKKKHFMTKVAEKA